MTQREKEILNNIVAVLKKELDPGLILLFGSRTKHRYNRSSDFDIALDKKKVNVRLIRKIKEEIDNAAGLYKVDIVFLKSVDRDFRDIILETGRVIYERSD